MAEDEIKADEIDWRQADFDGARREQLRRWAALPLEDALDAVEEMGVMAGELVVPTYARTASAVETRRAADGARSPAPVDRESGIELLRCPPVS